MTATIMPLTISMAPGPFIQLGYFKVIPKKVAITTAGKLTVPITVKMRVASLFRLARFEW